MEGERERAGLSWRVQAFLWPAVCSAATLVVWGVYALARDGLQYSPGIAVWVAWVIVFVPIIVVVCSLVLGGAAAAVGVLVRAGFGVARPNTSPILRAVVLASITGSAVAGVVISFFALLGQSWSLADEQYGYAVVVGAVAAFASARYARRLFGEPAGVPEPDVV